MPIFFAIWYALFVIGLIVYCEIYDITPTPNMDKAVIIMFVIIIGFWYFCT